MQNIFDSHAHYDDPRFDDDRDTLLSSMASNGVRAIMNVGNTTSANVAGIELAKKYPFVYCSIGIHPDQSAEIAAQNSRDYLDVIAQQLSYEKAMALGEIGLDYYWSDAFVAQQTEAFVAQLRLAARFDLPVAIHTRAAWDDMCRIIEAETERARADGRRLRGVFHAFSEGAAAFERLCGCGDFRFGIGGTVTFKKSGVAEIVRTMPLDRIVLETDCPYLTPAPYRGQRNESAYVRLICDKIAELKGLAAETVAAATTANAEALFGIRYTEKNTERR